LRQKGTPGILPSQFLLHEGRAFLLRPFIEVFPDQAKLTLPQLLELKESVEQIHKNGYIIRDTIQIGLWKGHVYHYDLGSAIASTDKHDQKFDMENVASWFSRADFSMYNPPTYAERTPEEIFGLKKKKQ